MKLVDLVIDDNSEIIDFIQDILSEKYSVLSAPNGQKALDIIGDHTVHLVISDIMMPVMNGLTFCQQLKSDVKYSHIPVILLTAKKSIETKIE